MKWREGGENCMTRSFVICVIRIIKSRRMSWAGHVARMGEKRNAYSLLVGKPERKRPLGKPRRMLVDNIKMVLLERRWGGADWIGLALEASGELL
jgi:hypothetical protein